MCTTPQDRFSQEELRQTVALMRELGILRLVTRGLEIDLTQPTTPTTLSYLPTVWSTSVASSTPSADIADVQRKKEPPDIEYQRRLFRTPKE